MTGKFRIALCILCVVIFPCKAQESLIVVPPQPRAGSEFAIHAVLNGMRAADTKAREPDITGNARCVAIDIRPFVDMNGISSTDITWKFTASGPGKIVIQLSVTNAQARIDFAPCAITVLSRDETKQARRGAWEAPGSVYAGQNFTLKIRAPDGSSYSGLGFAIAGCIVSKEKNSGAWQAVIPKSGLIRLPRLELQDSVGAFEVAAHDIRALPSGNAQAVGRSFTLAVTAPSEGSSIDAQRAAFWDIRLCGFFQADLASAPEAVIQGPRGRIVPADGQIYTYILPDGRSVLGRKGFVTLSDTGLYSIQSLPYTVINTETGAEESLSARAVQYSVKALPLPDEAALRRLAEYAAVLKARRQAFPPFGIQKKVEDIARTFGNSPPPQYVLPAYGWFIAAAAVNAVGFVIGFVLKRKKVGIAAACLCVLCAAFAAASFFERAGKNCVALAGSARNVPSEWASVVRLIPTGTTGRVVEEAGLWVLVHFGAYQDALWMEAKTIYMY